MRNIYRQSKGQVKDLEDIAEIIDSRHKTPTYVQHGYPMVRVVDVKSGALNLDDTKKVSKETYIDFSKGRDPKIGDLIISRVGSYGNVAYVNSEAKFCLGQNVAMIVPKINSRFLYYQLISPIIKSQIEQMVVGAVQKTLSLKYIKQLRINTPSESIQKSIAHILGTLDDKIHLNHQINATLESMAQALFQSWFVHFDPVIDNALAEGNPIPEPLHGRAEARKALGEGRKSLPETVRGAFPSRFVFSEEMGWIPEGWGVSTVGEEVETIGGGTPSTKNDEFWVGGEHCFCTPKDMSKLNSITLLDTERKLTDAGVNKISSGKLPSGTVLMSSRAPIGYLAISDASVSVNQGIIAMLPNERYSAYYLLLWSKFNMRQIKDRANGSTFQEISKKNFRPIPFLVPDFDIMDFFSKYVDGFLSEIKLLEENTQSLVRVRDTLLPKLLSGELEIEEIGTFSTKGKNK